MHELMVTCQELVKEDVDELVSGYTQPLPLPIGPPSAVAEPAKELDDSNAECLALAVKPDEETFAAMRWASQLCDDSNVLSLIRSLPKEIVDEQVRAYRARDSAASAAVAVVSTKAAKLNIGTGDKVPRMAVRMMVAARFHKYCQRNGIHADRKLP